MMRSMMVGDKKRTDTHLPNTMFFALRASYRATRMGKDEVITEYNIKVTSWANNSIGRILYT